MRKTLSLILSMGLLVGSTGCGSSDNSASTAKPEKNEIVITPQTTGISGALGKAYSVVERNYKAQGGVVKKINVEIELTDPAMLPEGFDSRTTGESKDKGLTQYAMLADFMIDFLDEDGDIIETASANEGTETLLRLTQGDRGILTFYLPTNEDKVKSFRIRSDYFPNELLPEQIAEAAQEQAIDDIEFEKAMEHTEKALETTTKAIESMANTYNEINKLLK